jgi:hypothetical protein
MTITVSELPLSHIEIATLLNVITQAINTVTPDTLERAGTQSEYLLVVQDAHIQA